MMRKLTAPFILSPEGKLLSDFTLIADGPTIIDLVHGVKSDAEHFDGILCPGFINTHCHLELSHLKGKISPGNKLHGFIRDFINIRNLEQANVHAVSVADDEMWRNGIQGVGDVCNGSLTFAIKGKSKIRYHSFIELFSMSPENVQAVFESGQRLFLEARLSHADASIVPHAPYSVPSQLFKLISEHYNFGKSVWSIHNQETESENEMFVDGSGELLNLFGEMGIDTAWLAPVGKRSPEFYASFIPQSANVLLVHNTYMRQEDIDYLKRSNAWERTWMAICVNANLFIEKQVPEIPMMIRNKCKITLGTDSLASNAQLSILEEIKTIHHRFPQVSVESMLTWATKNGADLFGWNDLGRFSKGCESGVLQITFADDQNITGESEVIRVV